MALRMYQAQRQIRYVRAQKAAEPLKANQKKPKAKAENTKRRLLQAPHKETHNWRSGGSEVSTKPLNLPWPPSSLSGHANGHWRDKSKVTKTHRRIAYGLTLDAGWRHKPIPSGDIKFCVTLTPPDNRSDRLNYINRLKPYYDGIAEALGVNDKRFCIPEFVVKTADKARAGVTFEILGIDVQVVF